ncbi:hypothetical protein HMPREF2800_03705 [Anaerosphaera sp. HMSC064C01]|nr:hypothetical protein HMPREF2800_03705 [Anaerosphaera sp. HMSC064C01]
MSNLSQEKRKEMLEYINKLKEIHKDDESIIALEKIETALTEKKYGLVWEEHEEEVDKKLVHNIPVFTEVEERKIIADENEGFNFLLEGDNLHSLKLLEKTHKGKIDVIYIDPPYNTGSKEENFKYDDNRVDSNDAYRHSKWLSFMNERLRIAKNLLTNDGVLFISIDNNEFAQAKLLCDGIFGDNNFVAIIPRLTSPQRFSQEKNINISNDFVLVYQKTESLNLSKILIKSKSDKELKKDNIGYFYEGDTKALIAPLSQGYSKNCDYDVEYNGKTYSPVNQKGVRNRWFWTKERMNKAIELGLIRETKNSIRMQIYQDKLFDVKTNTMKNKELGVRFTTLDLIDNCYSNPNGVSDYESLNLDKGFNNPKPKALLMTLIKLHRKNNAIILDFFAGSGTTAHAVMQLNKEDGGKRKYILCTNNENKICEEVTYKRLQNIQEDLPHNLKYFKTDFTPKFTEEEDILSLRLLNHIKEMVELENMCEIDGVNRVIILGDENLKQNIEAIKDGAYLYMPVYILLSIELKKLIEKKNIHLVKIPEYYFMDELREANEI